MVKKIFNHNFLSLIKILPLAFCKRNSSSSSSSSSTSSSNSTPIGVYTKLSQISSIDFTISAKAKAFITEHPDLFPAKSDVDCNNYVNYGIEYKHLSKSADNYGDSMVCVNGTIEQIMELKPEETGLKDTITLMRIEDGDYNDFCAFYIGTVDLYEDDSATIYGVPLNMGSYKNNMNGTTTCAVVAAAYAGPQIAG